MRYTADPSTDTPRDISRLIVPEAARVLGISPEAVRNRLSRGTLDSVKENGTVYVLLEADRVRHTADTLNDRPRSTADIPSDTPDAHAAALVAAKDETINLLRSQLEAEREANRENRRIIAGLVQRVPELEAPRNGHETATTEPDREKNTARPPGALSRPQSPARGGAGGSGSSDGKGSGARMSVRRKIDGRRMAELRDARFLDRKDLAEAVGVSHHTISRLETGRTLYPHRSTIRAIALVLGVGPDDLVART